jgi:hypothetical protein
VLITALYPGKVLKLNNEHVAKTHTVCVVDQDQHGSAPVFDPYRGEKMTHKSEEVSSFEVPDVLL